MTTENTPTTPLLRQRLANALTKIQSERLPNWEQLVANDPKIQTYLAELDVRMENSIRDLDGVRFEQELKSIERAWQRVNELLAEAYRAAQPDPNVWELRYVKWMKLAFVKFSSPKGDFYLVPRPPKHPPAVKHWYTVDEMMEFVRPEISALLNLSDQLPLRPEAIAPPKPGEKFMIIDATGPEPRGYYKTHKAGRYG